MPTRHAPTWGTSSPSPSSDADHSQHGWLHVTLGRLLERSEHVASSVERIETRLERGDQKFETHEARIAKLEASPSGQESRMERLIKRWLAYLLPAGALLATGSWQQAADLLVKLTAGLK